MRDHRAAPAPNDASNGQANAASDAMAHVRRLIFEDSDCDEITSDDEGTAASATGNSRSSRSRTRDRNKPRERSKSRGDDFTAENNPCKYCKRHKRRNRHPQVPAEQCFWNKKWKGFRPRYCCKVLGTRFRPREDFSAKLGGYDDETTSGEETE